MKKDNGINLISLIIYIVVMLIAMAVLSKIVSNFYINSKTMEEKTKDIASLNTINTYMLEQVKKSGNTIKSLTGGNLVIFSSGDVFEYKEEDHTLFFNNTPICSNIQYLNFSSENNNKVLSMQIRFATTETNGNLTLRYKLEEIY